MARKKRKTVVKPEPTLRERLASQPRRTWLLTAAGAVAAVGGASALHAWDVRTREQHDLGVIGNGSPVVVQVHDRTCPTCRSLKGAMGAVMKQRSDITYRIADLATDEGRKLAQRYNATKTTLLFFDGSGQRRYTHTGNQSVEQINAMVDDVLSQMDRTPSPRTS